MRTFGDSASFGGSLGEYPWLCQAFSFGSGFEEAALEDFIADFKASGAAVAMAHWPSTGRCFKLGFSAGFGASGAGAGTEDAFTATFMADLMAGAGATASGGSAGRFDFSADLTAGADGDGSGAGSASGWLFLRAPLGRDVVGLGAAGCMQPPLRADLVAPSDGSGGLQCIGS